MFSPSTGRGALERPSHLRPPQDSNAVTGTPRALARRFKIERDALLRMLGLGETESAAAIPCRHPLSGTCWQALRF
jgi:hypothetical protein